MDESDIDKTLAACMLICRYRRFTLDSAGENMRYIAGYKGAKESRGEIM